MEEDKKPEKICPLLSVALHSITYCKYSDCMFLNQMWGRCVIEAFPELLTDLLRKAFREKEVNYNIRIEGREHI